MKKNIKVKDAAAADILEVNEYKGRKTDARAVYSSLDYYNYIDMIEAVGIKKMGGYNENEELY